MCFEKDELETLKDAKDELMLSIEDDVLYKFGEFYVKMNIDEATDILKDKRKQLKAQKVKTEEEINEIRDKLAMYKSTLYGKFGHDKINLEDE